MLCKKCNKRPAVVYVATNTEGNNPQGYCLVCAKEMGIKPVDDLIKRMGLSPEDMDAVQEQMDQLMANIGDGDISSMMENLGVEEINMDSDQDRSENPDDFSPGGAPAFPTFFKSLFNNISKGLSNNVEGHESYEGERLEVNGNDKKHKDDRKKQNRKHLDLYCTDLTRKAQDGRIDRIIGRDKETERVIQILSRRTKNNPCLIGEPGVGKTAIAEGLALRISSGNVPYRLKDKEIHLLDLTALIAGTQFRGQFESRIKGLTEEVKQAGNIILFIDEVHNLVGTGDSDGTMNAANILKPALSRGEIQVIGATTFNEYRKYIEKDSALERRFQPVKVSEPSVADTIDVLIGVKSYYEDHHRVTVPDVIVKKAVVFSERYINDRFLPDKAIDLLDESCVCAALRNKQLETYDRLKDERAALKRAEQKITSQTEINFKELQEVRTELARVDNLLNASDEKALYTEVTEDDVAKVIELWTAIPATRVRENELSKLSDIDVKLKKKVIGQNEAVDALAAAIKRSRVQISPRRRPASFIFVGPTGVGKTELVKVLSQELFDTPETLIRLDMSEFMEKHSVSRIIGSPPGYVGYDEAGQVTEKVRRRPYSVLLFDEIEKAHPDVLNILLQILDEGKVTDAHGRVVNFENTVIIMTSNAGSEKKENALGFAKTEFEASREKALKALSDFLRPEFIARVDEIIIFRPLTLTDYENIADLMLSEYVGTLSEKGIRLTFDRAACEYLAKTSFGGKSGARDIRNKIRREVEDKIATAIIEKREDSILGIHIRAEEEIKLDII